MNDRRASISACPFCLRPRGSARSRQNVRGSRSLSTLHFADARRDPLHERDVEAVDLVRLRDSAIASAALRSSSSDRPRRRGLPHDSPRPRQTKVALVRGAETLPLVTNEPEDPHLAPVALHALLEVGALDRLRELAPNFFACTSAAARASSRSFSVSSSGGRASRCIAATLTVDDRGQRAKVRARRVHHLDFEIFRTWRPLAAPAPGAWWRARKLFVVGGSRVHLPGRRSRTRRSSSRSNSGGFSGSTRTPGSASW